MLSRFLLDPDVDLVALADRLDELAQARADRRLARAAAALRKGRVGRPAVDDAARLSDMRWMRTSGAAPSDNAAATFAAVTSTDQHSLPATVRRLRRKLRRVAKIMPN